MSVYDMQPAAFRGIPRRRFLGTLGAAGSSVHGPMVMTHDVLAIPDRLPSLIVLVGFWIPPAVAGWVAAGWLQRGTNRARARVTRAVLVTFVLGYAAAWFFFNLGRMPPYIPGATTDPTFAPPRAVAGLAVVASALVLPASALACALAFRRRRRMLGRTPPSGPPAWPDFLSRRGLGYVTFGESTPSRNP